MQGAAAVPPAGQTKFSAVWSKIWNCVDAALMFGHDPGGGRAGGRVDALERDQLGDAGQRRMRFDVGRE